MLGQSRWFVTDPSGATGVGYDENGATIRGSKQVNDRGFSDRYIVESPGLLDSV